MYKALKHFKPWEFKEILRIAKEIGQLGFKFFFGSVPDYSWIWNFYDTSERKAEYYRRISEGTEAIGSWWLPPQIEGVAHNSGVALKWIYQDPVLHTAHYRFDFLLEHEMSTI